MTRQCFDEFHRLFGIRYPFGDYHQAFVPGVQRRRDGEPRLRHVPRPAGLHQPGHPRASGSPAPPRSRTRWRTSGSATSSPRSGGTTCGSTSRSPSTWATGSPPTSPSTPTRGSTTPTPGASGGSTPTSGRAPTRSPATAPSTPPPRCRTSTASPTPRARAILKQLNATLGDEVFFGGRDRPLHAAPLRQRDHARPVRELGAGRRRRPVRVHRATGCAPPARTRSCSTAPPAWSGVRRPPSTPPTGRTRIRVGRRGAGRRPGPTKSLTVDGPETPFDVPAGAAVVLDPYEDTWALLDARPGDGGDPQGAAARHGRATRSCAPASGTTSAAPSTTPRSTRPTCSTSRCASLPVEDTEDSRRAHHAVGSTTGCVPLQPDPARRSRRLHDAAPGQARRGRSPAPSVQLAAFRAAIGTATDAGLLRGLARRAGPARRASTLDLDLRWRVLVRLATLGAVDLAELDAALERRADRRSPGSRHAGARRRCPTRRPRPGRGSVLHRRGRRAQLRARGGRPRHVAGRPGASSPSRTSTATSPSCPTPSRYAAAGCWPTPPRHFFPRHLADRRDPRPGRGADRGRRPRPRPSAAGSSTRPTTWAQARRPRGLPAPMSDRPRRPGPTVRTRVHELAPRANAATRTGSPPRSRSRSGWPGRARRRAGSG